MLYFGTVGAAALSGVLRDFPTSPAGGGFLTAGLLCRRVMLRRLLACLALLTGLAAAGAPAQAQFVALSAQAETSASSAAAAQGQSKSAVVEPRFRGDFAQLQVWEPVGVPPRVAPTVRIGCDRTRE